MVNSFYTPAQAAEVAANLTAEDAFLSALVSRNFENDLLGGGKGGAPVSIKMPTTLIARTRSTTDVTSSIVLDDVSETFHTFNLSRAHDYSAVGLSEADLTLNLTNFGAQVLKPQTDAIVDYLEHKVATALLAVPKTNILGNNDVVVTYDPANPVKYFTAIRKQLRDNGVEAANLNVAVGTTVYANLLDQNLITDVSASGSTAALRDGGIGRIRGFNIVETTRIPEDEILAFHRDAVVLATRAPVVPQGASFGASVAAGGFNLRYLRDYDANHTQDRSIVSTFSGVGIFPTYTLKRDYDARTVSVVEIPNGGILHLDTVAGS